MERSVTRTGPARKKFLLLFKQILYETFIIIGGTVLRLAEWNVHTALTPRI